MRVIGVSLKMASYWFDTIKEEFSACAHHKLVDVVIDNSEWMLVAMRIFLEFPQKTTFKHNVSNNRLVTNVMRI